MKTTLDISNTLLNEAMSRANHGGTTLNSLVERGLRWILSQDRGESSFKLRDASVDGAGLHPDAAECSWDQRRALSYEVHDD
jgi:hypothetical protein